LPGIAAAEAAGATVIVVTAAHLHRLETSHTTIDDYAALSIDAQQDGRLSLRPASQP
jgi:sugar-phosphatase